MTKLMTHGVLLALLACAGCHPGEGERCNPLLFSDECGDGLVCAPPPGCVVAFCCPPAGAASTSTSCAFCPTDDAGVLDASPEVDAFTPADQSSTD